jgi:sterol desaturase/sphingolipid hydroxylase (fatty acid hydroxylase superfamily)
MSTTEQMSVRFGIFVTALALMLLWEWLRPFRGIPASKLNRLGTHLGLMALNIVFLRLLSGGGAYGTALLAAEHRWGLFHRISMPDWLTLVVGLLLLDFAIYGQHVVFHKVAWLWRLHKVHHSDRDFDTTTAIRFHPAEIVLSMFYKMLLVLAFGIAADTVLLFEVLLNACAQFNHGNVRLPEAFERGLRWLLITPDFHRIHHSSDRREADTNFGFSVPWWDRLCGTYCPAPRLGQDGMEIGLTEERGRLGLSRLLLLPFSRAGV